MMMLAAMLDDVSTAVAGRWVMTDDDSVMLVVEVPAGAEYGGAVVLSLESSPTLQLQQLILLLVQMMDVLTAVVAVVAEQLLLANTRRHFSRRVRTGRSAGRSLVTGALLLSGGTDKDATVLEVVSGDCSGEEDDMLII
jgi:hypothetical protein